MWCRPCCCLFCLHKLPICRLCITETKLLFNYRTYKTTNRWRSVDAHFNILFIQHLLPSIIVVIIIWAYWWSFWQIKTLLCSKAMHSNILSLFTFTRPRFIYLAKRFIVSAIHLFINRYSQATTHHSPIIYLQLKLSVKIHKDAGETIMHAVLLFLHSLIPDCFDYADHHQQIFSLSLWLPCRPNQCG